jgi:hypothetical protein
MSEYAGAISAGSSVLGAGTKAYGAYAAGRQAQDYYGIQSGLNMRSKAEASRAIQLQVREANIMRDQADQTLQDAEWIRQLGAVKERDYQKQTDKGVSSMYAHTAKSGIAMNYGSPMDVIDEAVTERAKAYDILKWGNDVDYYHKKNEANRIKEKATIMLDTAKVNESNLPMFDYQSTLYSQAGQQAKSVAQFGMLNAYFGALDDVFGDTTLSKLKKALG